MTAQTSFGRRQATPSRIAPTPALDSDTLSPEAEAFRAQLAASRAEAEPDFGAWHRAQRSKRLLAWGIGIALMLPGVVCFALDTPWYVSIGLEVFGIAANMWLRQERRRRISEIASWDAPQAMG